MIGINKCLSVKHCILLTWLQSSWKPGGNWLFRWDCIFSGGILYPSANYVYPASTYLFKLNSSKKCVKLCLNLTIKTWKRHHWRRSGVFINFKHISNLFLLFHLLTVECFVGAIFLLKVTFLIISLTVKGTVMQIEKALINDLLRVPEVSWKFGIPTIYNFALIYLWILLFS